MEDEKNRALEICRSWCFFVGFGSKRYRLFYGELREPYLSPVDFVYLNRMTKTELKKDKIQSKYVTEYMFEKDRTFYERVTSLAGSE
ncbi:MAG: hypothetical protein ACFFDM_09960 [Candidatus Thorarchaeota archaeon]